MENRSCTKTGLSHGGFYAILQFCRFAVKNLDMRICPPYNHINILLLYVIRKAAYGRETLFSGGGISVTERPFTRRCKFAKASEGGRAVL
jgi:hypothetical protein